MTATRSFALILQTLLIGLAYYGGAYLGVTQTITPEGIAILWPPNSILLACFLILPYRRWPWIALAALVAECLADVPAFPLWAAVTFGLINILETSLAALLIRKTAGSPFDFDSLKRGARFLLYAPLISASLAGFCGAAVYLLLGRADTGYLTLWRLWWFGDALGLILITPVIVIFWRWLEQGLPKPDWRALGEFTLMLVLLVVLGINVFPQGESGFHLTPIALLPITALFAMRHGMKGASVSVLAIAVMAVAHMVRGITPYSDVSPQVAVWLMQEYLAVVAVLSVGLAVLLHEITLQRDRLRLQERALASTNDAIIITEAQRSDQPIIWANAKFADLFGYTDKEILGRNCRFLQGDDREQPEIDILAEHIAQQKPCRVTLRNYTRQGKPLWIDVSIAPVTNELGEVTHFVGVQHDVTEQKSIEIQLRETKIALQRQNRELDNRVKERTEKLEQSNLALEQANRLLSQLASTDHLTGIANRRHFHETAEREINRAARGERAVSLIMFDLDHFKQINDRYGHEAGDLVLEQMVCRTQQTIRPLDLFGRIGGEEFLILLPDIELEQAEEIAERLRIQIAALDINYQEGLIRVTASFGVAQWDGSEGLDDLIRRADDAQYQAKHLGRNRVRSVPSDAHRAVGTTNG